MQHLRTLATNLPGNLRGGISSAAVSLGILLPLGLLAFAPLGAEFAGAGIGAAFVTGILGAAVVALVGGSAVAGSGPKTPTTLIYAAFVGTLVADPALRGNVDGVLLVAASCVGLAGLMQVLFAALRLGSIVSFVPLPVVAGFMDGIAVLIILAQLKMLTGMPVMALVLGAATAAATWITARRLPRAPWALIGIVLGTALHWLVVQWLDASSGPLLGRPAGGFSPVVTTQYQLVVAYLPQIAVTAFVIALIGSLDGLMTAAGVDARLYTVHHPNRLLLAQGLGNLACAAFGGLPVVNSSSVQFAAHRAGGRGGAAGVVCAVVLLLVMTAGAAVIGIVPAAVSAGVMIIVGLGTFDDWSRTVWRQVRSGAGDRDSLWALATVAIVCVTTVAFGFVTGIAVGVALSVALFVAALNRSLVRSVTTGETRGSRRIYAVEEERVLRARGAQTQVVELEGPIFFGNANRFVRDIEVYATDARFVIIDMKRVTMIDASGAFACDRLASRVRAKHAQLLLAAIVEGDRHARALRAHGAFTRKQDRHWYSDVDRALEYAERRLLEEDGRANDGEMPLAELTLLRGMDAPQRTRLSAYLTRVELAPREVLFRRGEPGDHLFALAKGSVSMLADLADGLDVAHRLATFTPGVVFGEAAMLDGGGRTASGVADEPSVVYELTRAAFDSIREHDPDLAHIVLLNIACQLSARLRFATMTIQVGGR